MVQADACDDALQQQAVSCAKIQTELPHNMTPAEIISSRIIMNHDDFLLDVKKVCVCEVCFVVYA